MFKFGLISLLLFLLISIRAFESVLFYDPFIAFFKSEYQNKALPDFNNYKLLLSLSFRFLLNSIFSLGIIFLLFQQRKLFVFALKMYLLSFFVLFVAFIAVLYVGKTEYLILFYIRRFIIHPLLLLLFVPALYYQTKLTSS